ncbi:MAG: (2Fe-2S)-binding protein [Clostridiaceae bacterium]|nr:(2Fe-2S)-binding protein [Eubacteriales bacterium]
MTEEKTIVCRCSDVTLEEVRALIAQGYDTFDEIKRITRIGMGPCKGKTCTQLVLRELSIATGQPVASLKPQTTRPPVTGVRLELIAREGENHEA